MWTQAQSAGGTASGGSGASDGARAADKTAMSSTHVEMYISITHISTEKKNEGTFNFVLFTFHS